MRFVCSFVFVLFAAASAHAQSAATAGGDPPTQVCDTERSEPLVLWDITGWTLLGEVHGNLAVYNNGFASVSSANGDVRMVVIEPDVALQLRDDLIRVGAATLCDQGYVTDSPLTTVTVLGDGADARAHTFSYWVPERAYSRVQAAIDLFLAAHFPGFTVH
jgi:hypothetical protein